MDWRLLIAPKGALFDFDGNCIARRTKSTSAVVTLSSYFHIASGKAGQFRADCREVVDLCEMEPDHLALASNVDGDNAAVSREDYEDAEAARRRMQIGKDVDDFAGGLVSVTDWGSMARQSNSKSSGSCSAICPGSFLPPSLVPAPVQGRMRGSRSSGAPSGNAIPARQRAAHGPRWTPRARLIACRSTGSPTRRHRPHCE